VNAKLRRISNEITSLMVITSDILEPDAARLRQSSYRREGEEIIRRESEMTGDVDGSST